MPFDLRHRRWPIVYTASPSIFVDEKSKIKDDLSRGIEKAIRDVVQSGLITSKINLKDKRVAQKLSQAILFFLTSLSTFVQQYTGEYDFSIFQNDYDDLPGTNYPDPKIVELIVKAFRHHKLSNESNRMQNQKFVPWSESFIIDLKETAFKCEKILDRYADRDDEIISVVEEVQNRANDIAQMIYIMCKIEDFAGRYDNGVIENHIEFYRYFFLTIVKARRIIRKFGGE